jgi:hypothetical protein
MSPESRKAVETVLIERGFKADDPDLERRVVRVHSTRRSPPLSLPELVDPDKTPTEALDTVTLLAQVALADLVLQGLEAVQALVERPAYLEVTVAIRPFSDQAEPEVQEEGGEG